MRLVPTLGWLYGAFALAFLIAAVWSVATGTEIVGFPWWVFLVVGAFNATFSVAVLRRVRAVVRVLRFVHTSASLFALAATYAALRGMEDTDPWRAGAKCIVHAALAVFWWRSRRVTEWFGRSPRENGRRG